MKHMPEKTNDHRGCLACGFPFWDDLTPDEQAERKALREEYIADWRRSTIDVLENTYIDHGDGRVTKLPKKRT